jgi:phosphate transport system substrate-binding protein
MHIAQDKPAQATASLKFFDWAYANGDKAAADLDYVALPDSLKALIHTKWASIKDTSGKSVATK